MTKAIPIYNGRWYTSIRACTVRRGGCRNWRQNPYSGMTRMVEAAGRRWSANLLRLRWTLAYPLLGTTQLRIYNLAQVVCGSCCVPVWDCLRNLKLLIEVVDPQNKSNGAYLNPYLFTSQSKTIGTYIDESWAGMVFRVDRLAPVVQAEPDRRLEIKEKTVESLGLSSSSSYGTKPVINFR